MVLYWIFLKIQDIPGIGFDSRKVFPNILAGTETQDFRDDNYGTVIQEPYKDPYF